MKNNIYAYTLEELQAFFSENNEAKFRASQVYNWLYQKRVNSFAQMNNLSKRALDLLTEHFDIEILTFVLKQESIDGTIKFLFKVRDHHFIEAVLMKHDYGYSVCVSTQIGCKMGCTFCASTISGVVRNLDSGEIMAQVIEIQKYLDNANERVSSLVLMGSGEPFDNYDNVIKFINLVNNDHTLNIGARHITVSTSGIVPRIYDFADLNLQVTLAISLHATTNTVRSLIMPINRRYPLEELIKAIKYYNDKTKRRVTLEFGLLNDVNDSIAEALRLGDLIKPLLCHVNVIPINDVSERKHKKPSLSRIKQFVETLEKQGINATIRKELGSDIDAACGQLRAKKASLIRRRMYAKRINY